MTAVSWVFRKHWHPQHRRAAQLRALWWIVVRRHETEICGRCGGPVGQVWHAPDDLWIERNGYGSDHGVLCVHCFDSLAGGLWWECADGVFPTCTSRQCAHHESMIIIAKQRDDLWDEFVEMRRQRDEWWDSWLADRGKALREKHVYAAPPASPDGAA